MGNPRMACVNGKKKLISFTHIKPVIFKSAGTRALFTQQWNSSFYSNSPVWRRFTRLISRVHNFWFYSKPLIQIFISLLFFRFTSFTRIIFLRFFLFLSFLSIFTRPLTSRLSFLFKSYFSFLDVSARGASLCLRSIYLFSPSFFAVLIIKLPISQISGVAAILGFPLAEHKSFASFEFLPPSFD